MALPGGNTFEFCLEAYNAFNQMVWANAGLNVTFSNFGRTLAQANSGRKLQYALRFEF